MKRMLERICLLDLNYTLVRNQRQTRDIRPFAARLEAEEYREDLLKAIKNHYIIIVTARPNYQKFQTLDNLQKKLSWKPDEAYFNDIDASPPLFKESVLKRFVFPKHGRDTDLYYAVESNPKTREMYARYGIMAQPCDKFIKNFSSDTNMPDEEAKQMTLFDYS